MSSNALMLGAVVEGKWTGARFRLEKRLGSGANGDVYLVASAKGKAAMKICSSATDIALEWSILERVSPASGAFPSPMLVDDTLTGGPQYFYVMEWIPGKSLDDVLPVVPDLVLNEIVRQMLCGLSELHRTLHAFCDVKPQNVMVNLGGLATVRFVDVGGVTPFGRSVRQFTPYYDRAFWGLGSRISEPSYDLMGFALMLLILRTESPPAGLMQKTPKERQAWLDKAMRKYPNPEQLNVLRLVLKGRICEAAEFATQWRAARVVDKSFAKAGRARPLAGQTASAKPGQSQTRRSQRLAGLGKRRAVRSAQATAKRHWTDWLLWISLGTAATVSFAAWGIFLGWF